MNPVLSLEQFAEDDVTTCPDSFLWIILIVDANTTTDTLVCGVHHGGI